MATGKKVVDRRRAALSNPPATPEIPAFWQHGQFSAYGFFNPIKRKSLGVSYDSTNMNFVQAVGEATKSVFQHNSLVNSGPFIAIVLRVEVAPAGQDAKSLGQTGFEPGRENTINTSILGTAGAKGMTANPVRLNKGDKVFYEVKARVNELEILPWPWDQNDDYIIDQYPTFVAERELSNPPRVGDLIWVDFTNTNEGSQGIILEKIDIEPGPAPEPAWAPPRYQPNIPCCAPSRPKGAKIKTSPAKIPSRPSPAPAAIPSGGGHIVMIQGQKNLQSTGYAIYESLINGGAPGGQCFWGHIEGNGGSDHADRPADIGRETLIFVPDTFDSSKPYEMAYYFHGLTGFGKMYLGNRDGKMAKIDQTLQKGDFYYRMTKWLRKMVNEQKRNFVLVFPELSWSTGFGKSGPQKRGKVGARAAHRKRRVYWSFSHAKAPYAWQAAGINEPHGIHDDDFVMFHNNVISTLETMGVRTLDQAGMKDVLSWTGHSAGGHLLSSLVTNPEVMTNIKPNRITLSDCDYGTATPGSNPEKPLGWATAWNVYNMYIKPNAPFYPGPDHWLEMNVFAVPNSSNPGKNAKYFFKNTPGLASKGKKFKFTVSEKPKHIFILGEETSGIKQYVTWHPAKSHKWSALHSFTFLNENAPGAGSTPHSSKAQATTTDTAAPSNGKKEPGSTTGTGTGSQKSGPARQAELAATRKELNKSAAAKKKALKDLGVGAAALDESKLQKTYTSQSDDKARILIKEYIAEKNYIAAAKIEEDLIAGIDPEAFKGDLTKEQMQKQIDKLVKQKENLESGKTPDGKAAAGTIYDKENVVKSKIRLVQEQINLLNARKKAHNDAPDINNTNCKDCSTEGSPHSWKTWTPSNNVDGAPASRLIGDEQTYSATSEGKKYKGWFYGFGNTKSSLFPIHISQPNPGNPADFPNGAEIDASGAPQNYPNWLVQKWCPRGFVKSNGKGPRHLRGYSSPGSYEGNDTRALALYACLEIIERYWKQGIKIVGGPHDGVYHDAEILMTSHWRKNGNGNHKFNGAADFQIRFDNRKKSLPGLFIWASMQILQKTYRIPVGGAGAYLQCTPDSQNRVRGVNYYDQGKVVRGIRGGLSPGSYSHCHYDIRGHFDFALDRRRAKGMHLGYSHWICTDTDGDGKKNSGYNQVQGMGKQKQIKEHFAAAANQGQEDEVYKFMRDVFHRNGHDSGAAAGLGHNGKESKFVSAGAGTFPKDFEFPLVGASIPNLNQLCGMGSPKNDQYYWNGHSGGNPKYQGLKGKDTETKKEAPQSAL